MRVPKPSPFMSPSTVLPKAPILVADAASGEAKGDQEEAAIAERVLVGLLAILTDDHVTLAELGVADTAAGRKVELHRAMVPYASRVARTCEVIANTLVGVARSHARKAVARQARCS
ncbi:MAG: hypothetical protein H0T79_09580 [Deltaproteobacteria bacterium]|nr:hypothetical protein [Deltaproteobacteria bacterium]